MKTALLFEPYLFLFDPAPSVFPMAVSHQSRCPHPRQHQTQTGNLHHTKPDGFEHIGKGQLQVHRINAGKKRRQRQNSGVHHINDENSIINGTLIRSTTNARAMVRIPKTSI